MPPFRGEIKDADGQGTAGKPFARLDVEQTLSGPVEDFGESTSLDSTPSRAKCLTSVRPVLILAYYKQDALRAQFDSLPWESFHVTRVTARLSNPQPTSDTQPSKAWACSRLRFNSPRLCAPLKPRSRSPQVLTQVSLQLSQRVKALKACTWRRRRATSSRKSFRTAQTPDRGCLLVGRHLHTAYKTGTVKVT